MMESTSLRLVFKSAYLIVYEVTYERAKIVAQQGDHRDAYAYSEIAYHLIEKGKTACSSVIAVRYQQTERRNCL